MFGTSGKSQQQDMTAQYSMELMLSDETNVLKDFKTLISCWKTEGLCIQQIRSMLFEQGVHTTPDILAEIMRDQHDTIETSDEARPPQLDLNHRPKPDSHPRRNTVLTGQLQIEHEAERLTRRRSCSSSIAIPLNFNTWQTSHSTDVTTDTKAEVAKESTGHEAVRTISRATVNRERMVSPTDSFLFTDDETDDESAVDSEVEEEHLVYLMASHTSYSSESSYTTRTELASKRPTQADNIDVQQILLKMAAAEAGIPRSECCCGAYFDGKLPPSQIKELCELIINQSDSHETLHYTKAVARLCRDNSYDETTISRLQASYKFHTELLDRPKMSNSAAYAIAAELASILDGIVGEDDENVVFAKRLMWEVYGTDRDCWSRTRDIRDKYSHLYSGLRKMPVRLKPSSNPSAWIDRRTKTRRDFEDKLMNGKDVGWLYPTISDCREVISEPRNLSEITQYATTITPWTFQDGFAHARIPYERLNNFRLAQKISRVLTNDSHRLSWPLELPQNDDLQLLVIQAIGFIVAQAFQEHRRPGRLSEDEALTHILNAVGILNIQSRFSTQKHAKVTDFGRQFLQSMWICDSDRNLFDTQGLHYGPCKADSCWKIVNASVTQFDQSTALTAPTALPNSLQPDTANKATETRRVQRSSLERVRSLSDKMKPKASKFSTIFGRKHST